MRCLRGVGIRSLSHQEEDAVSVLETVRRRPRDECSKVYVSRVFGHGFDSHIVHSIGSAFVLL